MTIIYTFLYHGMGHNFGGGEMLRELRKGRPKTTDDILTQDEQEHSCRACCRNSSVEVRRRGLAFQTTVCTRSYK